MQITKTPSYVLYKRDLLVEDIIIRLNDTKFTVSKELDLTLRENWKNKEKEILEKGGKLYNGISYYLIDICEQDNKIIFNIGTLEYMYRSGINDLIRTGQMHEDDKYRHNGIFVGTTLITNDEKYIIVNLSGKSNNHHKQDLAGGLLEGEYNDKSNILYDVMYQEIEEETNIKLPNISSCILQMIYVANNGNIGLYFETKVNLSSNEVTELFKKNNDIDIKSLSFLNRDEYKKFLVNFGPSKQLIYKEFFEASHL